MVQERTSNVILWLVAIVLIICVCGFMIWYTGILQSEIAKQKNMIVKMRLEHEAATIAVNEAYQERREIYERAKDRLCEAEKKIGDNYGFCDMDIPDDLLLLWEKAMPTTEHGLQSSD